MPAVARGELDRNANTALTQPRLQAKVWIIVRRDGLLKKNRTYSLRSRTVSHARFRLRYYFCSLVGTVAAVLVRTVAERARLLRGFLKQKRSITLWTGINDRLVPVNDIALRIFRTAIKRFSTFRFLNNNLAFTTRSSAGHTNSLLLDVFALRII